MSMRSVVLRLLRDEIAKAMRMRLPYFGLVCIAVLSLLIYVAIGEVGQGNVTNGWGYVSLSMQLIFTDIGLIFVIVFSTMLVAEETRSGTVRPVLSAPVYRWQWYVAKVLTGLLYMLFLSLTSLVMSILLGSIHCDFGDVADSLGLVYGRGEVSRNFLLGLAGSGGDGVMG
jgi:ABC-type transport system involved in multi-copper enzyme maturation permease subunit